jgi:hypothetical protein
VNTAGALCSSHGWVTTALIRARRGSLTPVLILRPIAAPDLCRVRMQRPTAVQALCPGRIQRPIAARDLCPGRIQQSIEAPAAALFQMEKLVDPVCPAGVQALLRVLLRAREPADRQPEATRVHGLALPDFLQGRFCRLRASATRTSRI